MKEPHELFDAIEKFVLGKILLNSKTNVTCVNGDSERDLYIYFGTTDKIVISMRVHGELSDLRFCPEPPTDKLEKEKTE